MQIQVFGPEEEIPPGVVFPHQTHSANIVEVVTGEENLSECDGVWGKKLKNSKAKKLEKRGFVLGIKTADCAPVAFWDGERYGILHVGWRGLVGGIVESMLALFEPPPLTPPQEEGNTLNIFVGPMLPQFEIQQDYCYDAISEKFGASFFLPLNTGDTGGVLFDFQGALASLLPPQTQWDERITFDTPNLASWRRDRDQRRNVMTIQV